MTIKFELNKGIKILGVDRFNTSITVKELLNNYKVPYYKVWSGSIKDGYQRTRDQSKIDAIRDKCLKSPMDLVSFLADLVINIRAAEATTNLNKVKGLDNIYTLNYLEVYGPLWVVDGQHRLEGLEAAVIQARKTDPAAAKTLEDHKINVKITFNDDIYLEAYDFYSINHHAKKVSTEGAHRLLVDGVNTGNVNFVNELGKISLGYIECANIVDDYANNSIIWANRIKDFNEKAPDKPITATALTKLVEMIYQEIASIPNFHGKPSITKDIIEAYWQAIAEIFPIMFNRNTYRNYNILKSSQAEVMFIVLRECIKLDVSGGYLKKIGQLTDKNTWKKFIEKTLKNFQDTDAKGNKKKGQDCWLVGTGKGSMGQYTSIPAKNEIAKKLYEGIFHDNNVPGF